MISQYHQDNCAPAISVVIPSFNAQATIIDVLSSLECQRELEVELDIILVDDGSSDETVTLVRDSFPTVRVICQENAGPAAARNRGVQEATAEWIAFLDADDRAISGRLAFQIALTQAFPEVDLWCADAIVFRSTDEIKTTLKSRVVEAERFLATPDVSATNQAILKPEGLVLKNDVITSTVLVKRRVFLECGGFDTAFKGPEDLDLWLRVCGSHKARKVDVPVVLYQSSFGSLSMDDQRFLPQVLGVFDKAFSAGGVLAEASNTLKCKAVASQLLSASWMAYSGGARLRATKLVLQSMKKYPFKMPWMGCNRAKMVLRYLLMPFREY